MNRRELAQALGIGAAVPLFGLNGLPAPASEVTAAHIDTDDDVFHATIIFDRGREDFIVRGIYTQQADADAHTARLKAAHSTTPHLSWTIKVNRTWLQEHFIGERMGALKDVLERLEARLMIDAHGV